jgi:hypothetical protein
MIIVPEYSIIVGGEDTATLLTVKAPDVLINVADYVDTFFGSRANRFYYWYPINEISKWGYAPFFWSKKILDYHTNRKDTIFIHCAAGAHRSPMILVAWLKILRLRDDQIEGYCPDCLAIWDHDVANGTIPADLMTMYNVMFANPTWSLMGCLHYMEKRFER